MVARINTSKNITRALQYNEQKVGQGKAECLFAHHFLKNAERLSFQEKLHHFNQFLSLNESVKTNTLHVSINFHPKEAVTNEKLREIAQAYMQQIGFGEQPFLVYRHDDAGHPHIHIVSTNIRRDGNRISFHNLGRHASEKARKELEVTFGLIPAGNKKQEAKEIEELVSARKIVYGKEATQRDIMGVLNYVLNQYKYTNLQELNAVLSLYNVVADRGKEGGRIYQHKGLTYRILNEKGNKIGVPIKASAFPFKPTLDYLDKKFAVNEQQRAIEKQRLKTAIDWQLIKPNQPLSAVIKALEKQGISTILQRSKKGGVDGISYVDHRTKCVFGGDILGKAYSAQGILQRCKPEESLHNIKETTVKQATKQRQAIHKTIEEKSFITLTQTVGSNVAKAVENLLQPAPSNNYLPQQLKKKKRKRISQHH